MKKDDTGKKNNARLLDFIAEAGLLKRVKRSGWSVVGIPEAESVADHSYRCAVIGYVLARREGINAEKVLLMTLFNDLHEARITDLHKMAQAYIELKGPEDRAFSHQISGLPSGIDGEMARLRREYRRQKSPESVAARDADILECLMQAREYEQQGYSQAVKFLKKAPTFLETKSARALWREIKKADLNDWWFKISDFKR